MVVLALITTFAAVFLILYRRKRPRSLHWWRFTAKERDVVIPVGLGAWIGRRVSDEEHIGDTVSAPSQQVSPVEMDASVMAPVDMLEFEKSLALGQGPAELEDQTQRLSQRASWVSRMLSRVAHSSISTRSSSRSRWTQRSLAHTDDWEVFVREKTGRADGDTEGVATPGIAYSRPTTTSSYWSDDGKPFWLFDTNLDLPPKVRNFDRLSEGTFGRVVVRGRSVQSNPSWNA